MKVLYIAFVGRGQTGVNKKLIKKIERLNSTGNLSKGVFVSLGNEESVIEENNITYITVACKKVPKIYSYPFFWRFHVYYEHKIIFKALNEYLKLTQKEYDFFLLRYPIFYTDICFVNFMNKFGHKTIIEHNTFEIEETKLYLKSTFRSKYIYFSERYIASWGIRKARGVIGVTPEITNYELKRVTKKISSTSISNGFEVNTVPLKKVTNYNQKVLKLLFLSGGPALWHGLDRIINSLSLYKGVVKIELYIVGHLFDADKILIHDFNVKNIENTQIILMDYLIENELYELFNTCHLAIGTMALFRNKMNEGCVLKVREYLSRGIPFILGYDDVDLDDSEIKNYYLKFPNDESMIDFEKVISFAERVLSIPNYNQKIRDFAIKQIDYHLKINKILDFMKNLNNKV